MKISVCMASYNGAAHVEAQLASMIEQLVEGDEILVADDGSSDTTVAIVRSFGPPVRLVAIERVGGVVRNFERVLQAASGDAIVLADQDDVWLPGRLVQIRLALAHADLVVLNGEVVDGDLRPRGQTVFAAVGMKSGFLPNLVKNSFIGCCMAFRCSLRDRILPFPSGVPWHDWYIGLVAEWIGRVERIDDITLLYRRHGGNFSPTGEKSRNTLWRKLAMRWAVLRAVVIAVARRPTQDVRHAADAGR
ncbi:MAG: hypothetical protein RLZZ592_3037 [Pseudomonadota bacterium]|jgi:glycosyltransferase involved in cell wall biosynthesis